MQLDDGRGMKRGRRGQQASPETALAPHREPRGSRRSVCRRRGQRPLRGLRNRQRLRAYSPMPKVPDTGTNKNSRRRSAKGGEPAIQHQQIPGSAKFAAHRTLQYAAIHQAPHRLLQHLRMTLAASDAPAVRSRISADSDDPAAIAAPSAGAPAAFRGAAFDRPAAPDPRSA